MFCIFKSATALEKSSLSMDHDTTSNINSLQKQCAGFVGAVAALAPSQHHTWKIRGDQHDVVKEEEQGDVH